MPSSIIRLQPDQTKAAAKVLSSAFSHDPLVSYFLPKAKPAQLKALRHISAALMRYCQDYETIYTTAGEPQGVAIWLPPAEAQFEFSQLTRFLTSGLLAMPFYLPWQRLLTGMGLLFQELAAQQSREPHWYLAMLGVETRCQGQGIGGALLQPVLQRADQEGLPCYLETSTEAAVRFYQRQGFVVEDHREITPGLPYWKMKRAPLAQSNYS